MFRILIIKELWQGRIHACPSEAWRTKEGVRPLKIGRVKSRPYIYCNHVKKNLVRLKKTFQTGSQ